MSIVRELVAISNWDVHLRQIYIGLGTGGSITQSIMIKNTCSDGTKYEIEITPDLVVLLELKNSMSKKAYATFKISYFSDMLNTYSTTLDGVEYLFRFDTTAFLKKHNSTLEKVEYLYDIDGDDDVSDFITFSDFTNILQLADCIYVFLNNCRMISNRTYFLMRDKLEYHNLNAETIDMAVKKADLGENPNQLFDKLVCEALYEIHENTFLCNKGVTFNGKPLKELYTAFYNMYIELL